MKILLIQLILCSPFYSQSFPDNNLFIIRPTLMEEDKLFIGAAQTASQANNELIGENNINLRYTSSKFFEWGIDYTNSRFFLNQELNTFTLINGFRNDFYDTVKINQRLNRISGQIKFKPLDLKTNLITLY